MWQTGLPELPHEYESGFAGGKGKGLVCSRCIRDDHVRMAVSDCHRMAICDYCGSTASPFAQVDTLFEYVYRCLSQEYGNPWTHGIWPDKEEGGWIGITPLDTDDVLAEVGNLFADDSAIAESFITSIDHDWYEIDSEAGSPAERRIWGWDSFEERLLNGPRFLFSTTETEWGEESAETVFRFLASLAERITTGFVRTNDSGLVLFRARVDESQYLTTADELGSPDPSVAAPQRMSAAGVSCFHAAEDSDTAVEEIQDSGGQFLSVGRWSTTVPLLYADFATRLDLPCLFYYPASKDRPFIGFLREFVQRIERPAPPRSWRGQLLPRYTGARRAPPIQPASRRQGRS